MKAEVIRALERHRIAQMAHPENRQVLSPDEIISLIQNDNLLEGRSYLAQDIETALHSAQDDLEPYQVPVFKRIRAQRDLILRIQEIATQGTSSLTLDNLKMIHRSLALDPKEEPATYRQHSPVHRDYSQAICSADKISSLLRKFFENLSQRSQEATDPVAFAAAAHHQLMYIYPFRHHPGSTARFFTNLMFLAQGYPPLMISGLKRSEYYDALCQKDATALTEIFLEAFQQFL